MSPREREEKVYTLFQSLNLVGRKDIAKGMVLKHEHEARTGLRLRRLSLAHDCIAKATTEKSLRGIYTLCSLQPGNHSHGPVIDILWGV